MLSPMQRAMIASLRHGHPVPTTQLVDVIYGYRSDGGPNDAGNVIANQIYKMRQKLRALGVEIEHIGHARGAVGYRLKPGCEGALDALLNR